VPASAIRMRFGGKPKPNCNPLNEFLMLESTFGLNATLPKAGGSPPGGSTSPANAAASKFARRSRTANLPDAGDRRRAGSSDERSGGARKDVRFIELLTVKTGDRACRARSFVT